MISCEPDGTFGIHEDSKVVRQHFKIVLIFAIPYLLSTVFISFFFSAGDYFLCISGRGMFPSAVCKAVHSRVHFVFQMLWFGTVFFISCSTGD